MTLDHFPQVGRSPASILQDLEKLGRKDVEWKKGKVWSLVYYLDEEHEDLLRRAYAAYASTNYLNSFIFPALQQMERDVVCMAAEMCNNPSAVGAMTSGGTESILLAVLAYRNRAWKKRGGKLRRDILAPATVHPAFEKAAHLFGLRLVRIPVCADKSLDVEALKARINAKTLMLVCSAPCYPCGVVDPVEEVAAIAREKDLPMHVDACVGGFLLPWAERLGRWKEPWDFRVEGVSSISLDVHKFGFGAKGASVILYRGMELMKHQFFISTEFPGGIFVSPTLLGTRSGGAISAAWSALQHLGVEGYLDIVSRLLDGADRLREFFSSVPELEQVGASQLNILAFRTIDNQPDTFVLADFLEKKGWRIDRQQFPQCIHLTVLPTNLPVIEDFISDIREALEFAKSHPEATAEGNAAMYGVMARLPFRGMIEQEVSQLFEDLYGQREEDSQTTVAPAWWMGPLNRFLRLWERWTKNKRR